MSRSFPCILLAYGSFHPCLLDASVLAMGPYTPWLPHLDHAFFHSPLHPLREVNGGGSGYEVFNYLSAHDRSCKYDDGI